MADEIDDIEADIKAAITGGQSNDAAPAPAVEAPAAPVEEAPAAAAPEGETAEQRQARIDATGRAHDEKGKFTSKPKPAEGEQQTDQAQAATPAPEQKAAGKRQPHSHWKPELKAFFLEAPEAIQQALLDREADMDKGRQEWSGKAEEFNRLDRIIGPNRDRWARSGLSPDAAINQLLSMERAIQTNPVTGIAEVLRVFARGSELSVVDQIARANGLMLVQATNQGQPHEGDGQGQPPAQADPTVRRLEAELRQLTQWKQQQETAVAQSGKATMAAEVEAVRNDPKNLYFHNVKEDVAVLAQAALDRGDKRSYREIVQAAYDQAVWANPTTRALLITQQQRERDAEAAKAAAAKAEAARKASGSITGSPGPGAPAARANGSTHKNLDDDILADIHASMNAARA